MEVFGYSKKDINYYLVLNTIFEKGALSRTQLAQYTKLPPATITSITHDCLDDGILVEAGTTTTGRGRNQTLLKISDKLCAIGINIEKDHLVAILSNIFGVVIKQIRRIYNPEDFPQQIMDLVVDCVQEFLSEDPSIRIIGVAVGDPSPIDSASDNVAVSSQFKNWKNTSIKKRIRERFDLPVFVEMNDRLKTLAEMRYGIAVGCDNFICVHLGHGIGAGFVCEGKLIRGHNGYAGEFGHIIQTDYSDYCHCGNRGCLETRTSIPFLLHQLQSALAQGSSSVLEQICPDYRELSLEHVRIALEQNDRLVSICVYDIAAHLGDALAGIIALLNPQKIIFQGPMCALGKPLICEIQNVILRKAFPCSLRGLEFHISALEDLAGPLGASMLVFDDFLHTDFFK